MIYPLYFTLLVYRNNEDNCYAYEVILVSWEASEVLAITYSFTRCYEYVCETPCKDAKISIIHNVVWSMSSKKG